MKSQLNKTLLIPLKQWICDGCDEIINLEDTGENEGKLEMMSDDKDYRINEIRIIHKKCNCFSTKYRQYVRSSLKNLVGTNGLSYLLFQVEHFEFDNFLDFVFAIRRLQVPYFEQASGYLYQEMQDDFFKKNGLRDPYQPDALKRLIVAYKDSN